MSGSDNVQTLRWRGDRLELLDQRRLPGEPLHHPRAGDGVAALVPDHRLPLPVGPVTSTMP